MIRFTCTTSCGGTVGFPIHGSQVTDRRRGASIRKDMEPTRSTGKPRGRFRSGSIYILLLESTEPNLTQPNGKPPTSHRGTATRMHSRPRAIAMLTLIRYSRYLVHGKIQAYENFVRTEFRGPSSPGEMSPSRGLSISMLRLNY